MKVKEESEKVCLKLNIQKTKIMVSGPITSWQIDGEIVETVADFIFLGSKITADNDCSHEIKRRLLLGRKVMTNLDSILKSRDITLSTKVHLVKAMVFPVVRAPKNRCFWTVVLEKTVVSPLDCKEFKPVLNTNWKDWCWTWSSNILATWFEKLTHWKRPWCCKILKAEGEGGDRGWDGWMASPTQWTRVWTNSERYEGQRSLVGCSPWVCKELDMT